MKWKDLSINKKTGAIFSVQLLLLCIIGFLAYDEAGHIETALHRTQESTLVLSRTANQMNVDVIQVQQWLTDISATRSLDGLNDGFDEAEKSYQSFVSGLAVFRNHYEKTGNAAGINTTAKLKGLFDNYYAMGKKMAQAYIDQGPAGGNKTMTDFDAAAESLSESLEPFLKEQQTALTNDLGGIDTSISRVSVATALLALFSVLLMGGSLFVLSRSIGVAVRKSVQIASKLRDGDLTMDITVDSKDEAGQLLSALKDMSTRLRGIIANVIQSSDVIANGAKEISAGNTNLSQRTEEQASSLEETASSMEEMTGTVKQNADSASQAKQLADANRQRAANGAEVVHRTVQAMSEINDSSTRIADIIGTIDGIAFQTNLLALNAAVEAARAGEQGRGFAVVASEVRSLAQRSAEAAKEIKNLIEDSVGKVKIGTQLVDESGRTLEEIIEGTQKVADIIAEIAAASFEQASGIDQVNNAVTQMDTMTQDNAALVEEAAAASRSMEEQAMVLMDQVSYFKLDSGSRLGSAGTGSTAPGQLRGNGHAQPAKRTIDRTHLEHLKQAKARPRAEESAEWEKF